MKKYIADVLTALRFISAVTLIVLTIIRAAPEWALWVFVFGELTDAFDGMAARRWPFPEGQIPRYRHFAELYDMVIDVCLGLATLLYLTVCVNLFAGGLLTACSIVIAALIEFLVWGRLFGAPERCRTHCLWHSNPHVAQVIILVRRRFYLVAIGTAIALILFATNYNIFFKIVLVGIAVAIALALLAIKRDRMTEVKTK